ncbi:MAG: DUF11 domain-containing protein, partial [Gammaproteobacteria bacterium]|nr:DUF11 domain-containing protein [Gammaproteobacteria bacterium]
MNNLKRLIVSGGLIVASVFSHSVLADDYPATVDNTATVTLPAGVTDPNTANNSATDSNTLSVVTPQPTKAFSPSTIDFGDTSTLTITLTNSNNFAATLQSDFTDFLPTGSFLATPANGSTTCTGGSFAAVDGTNFIGLGAGAVIPANGSCTIIADVTSNTAGTYNNVSSTLDTGMGTSGTANATLIVQPQAELVIDNVSQVETNAGTTTFVFTVSIDNGVVPASNITFDYATADGTATVTNSDYVAITTTQGTITAGSTSTTISVTVNGDLTVESDEIFSVNISNPSANATITTIAGAGTIQNDDASEISIAATTNGNETGPVDGQFTVSLTNPSATDTVIAYSAGGTATAGDDYTALTGSVTIPAGSTSATIDVPVIDDTIVEGTESLTITLSSVTSGSPTIGATNNASIDLLDNDIAEIEVLATSVVEGDAGTVNLVYTVQIANAVTLASDVTFNYNATDGTATVADGDYTGAGGAGVISAGSTSTTISISVNGDTTVESDETVVMSIAGASSNATITTASANGTIINDDASEISIAATTNGNETGPVDGQFTVTLSSPSDTDTIIAYTVGGTATEGDDYSTLTLTLVIPAGSTSGVIDIVTTDDSLVEGTETVVATLDSVVSGTPTIGATNNASIDIIDNDASLIVVKRIDNSFGGTAVVGDFSITTDAGALTFGAGVDQGAGVTQYTANTLNISAGTYSLTESDLFAYNEGTWICDAGTVNSGIFNSGSITLAAGDAATCTITNTHRQAATLQVAKSWINANLNDAVNITTAGGSNNHNFNSVADTSTETDISTVINVYDGETITFAETFTTGTASDYSTTLSCTGATDTDPSNGLLIDPADAGAIIVCTYENRLLSANLVTSKTLSSADSTPNIGDTVSFLITVTNSGPDTATNVSLTDSLPAGLTAAVGNGAVSQGSYDGTTWSIGTLTNGANATLTLVGTVNAGTGGSTITNTTTAAVGDQFDNDTAGDDLSESVTVNSVIVATDDDFSASPVNGAAGGDTATVFANDTLNGAAVAAADVTPSITADGGLT